MTNAEYRNTLSEVSVILKNIDENLVKKIPNNVKRKIESDKSPNYKFEYNLNKSLSEQKMLKTTKLYLTMLYLKFLCTEEEKKGVLSIMSQNENYVTLKSYDGKLVRVPENKKDEYIKNQEKIKIYLEEGKTVEEIREILKKK